MRKSFIESKIKQNISCLLYAIEDITDVEFWAEDNIDKDIQFKILEIKDYYYKPRHTYEKEVILNIDINIENKSYNVNSLFIYNYQTKEFDYYDNYCLRWA